MSTRIIDLIPQGLRTQLFKEVLEEADFQELLESNKHSQENEKLKKSKTEVSDMMKQYLKQSKNS
jgi:hypothetical protein